MATDENLLVSMLERVTNPDSENMDNLAVQMFCMILQNNNDLITTVHELIVKKINSTNNTEATRAIMLLEECMSKGGSDFKKKTAKFTFLNELIALVLDKHPGPPVPVETKRRIMESLMLWTIEHEDKPKIKEVYDSLKKQVNFEHEPSSVHPIVREQRSSILGKDDETVAKLLKQGGEENYKKANLLIQHRFNQEARRTQHMCHLKSELKEIEGTMELLDEMLSNYTSETTNFDSREIMQELYNSCEIYNKQMKRWPDFLGDGEPEFLEVVLNTKDLLSAVIQRYKESFKNESYNKPSNNLTTATTTNTSTTTTTNNSLLSELLGFTLTTSSQDATSTTNSIKADDNTTMDELSAIFGNINDTNKVIDNSHHPSLDLLGNLDLLEPINVFESATKNVSANKDSPTAIKKLGFKELKEIDQLSEELFRQNLKEEQRLQSFKKETEKLTLNDLAKDKIQTSLNIPKEGYSPVNTPSKCNEVNAALTTSQSEIEIGIKDLKETDNNKMKSIEINESLDKVLNIGQNVEDISKPDYTSVGRLKPLAEITVDLDEVTPLDEGQRLLLDDDIQVTLNFTADRPSDHVSVIVMAVTNKSKFDIKDFKFEASAKKPCKIRLLPPTDVSMCPSKPFRPSVPINQVILLLNPTRKPVDVTCIVGYRLGDDPDPIKESIVAKEIPYV